MNLEKYASGGFVGDGWIEWSGGDCPVPIGTQVDFKTDTGGGLPNTPAERLRWHHNGCGDDIIAYRVVAKPLNGGKLSGDHYYRVEVPEPISPELAPYTAECADIIEALGMTFNEGEAFKALWRLAAARQGRGKPGNKAQYDADKVAHFGGRVAVQTRRQGAEGKAESDAKTREIG